MPLMLLLPPPPPPPLDCPGHGDLLEEVERRAPFMVLVQGNSSTPQMGEVAVMLNVKANPMGGKRMLGIFVF